MMIALSTTLVARPMPRVGLRGVCKNGDQLVRRGRQPDGALIFSLRRGIFPIRPSQHVVGGQCDLPGAVAIAAFREQLRPFRAAPAVILGAGPQQWLEADVADTRAP